MILPLKRISLGVVVFATSFAALAQETGLVLEEIVVTAQKRVESLIEVPVAVSVVSGAVLEQAQIRDITGLQQLAPSLVVNGSTGSTQQIISIRGIGTAGQNTGLEQSVGVFIDGVYRGRVGAAMGDYVDVEQIEILRGPQSTLFGKNTSAGVISVKTRKPEHEFGGIVEAAAGDFGMTQLRASITGPLSDSLAFRLSGAYNSRDGVITDVLDGREYNDRDRISFRGQLLWDIGDSTFLRLIGDYAEIKDVCCSAPAVFAGRSSPIAEALGGGPGSLPGGGPNAEVDTFQRIGASTPGQTFDNGTEDSGVSAELVHEFSATELTIIGASRSFEATTGIDADFQVMDLLSERAQDQDLEEWSLEIRLASAGAEDFDWMIGGFLFDQEILATDKLILGTQARAYADGLAQGAGASVAALEFLFGIPAGTMFANGTGTRNTFDYSASGFAVFTQGTWYINDRWSITGGLRYSDEEKDSSAVNTQADEPFSNSGIAYIGLGCNQPLPIASNFCPFQVFPAVDPYSVSFEDDNVSGTFNLSYDFSDTTSGYFRYGTGFKSGGINLSRNAGAQVPGDPTPDTQNPIFQSETVDSIELGLKTLVADGRAMINIAVFDQTLDDFQANSFDGLNFTVRNAAELEGTGVEIDYSWRATDSLTFSGGVVWQDLEYASYPTGSPTQAQIDADIDPPNQDLTGTKPNFVSDFALTGTIAWNQPVTDNLNFVFTTDYRYRTDYTTGQDLDPRTLQDDLLWVNASIGVEQADGNWSIQAWVKNATDEEVFNIVFDTPFQGASFNAFIDDPRTVGITGTIRF